MKTLQLTKEWLDWFQKERIQLTTSIDDREMFTKTFDEDIKRNRLNYSTVFSLINSLVNAFGFLIVDKIRLAWSVKLENDNLQFFNGEANFEEWKENVINGNYEFSNSYDADYEDSTEIYFNYSVEVDGQVLTLYHHKQTDRASIYLWYNPKIDFTSFKMSISMRKALFSIDTNFEMQLNNSCLESNNNLLLQMDKKLKEEIMKV